MRTRLALAMITLSVLVLEYARSGVDITPINAGRTPVTSYARAGADGPVVVVAHGFAGSQQMMQGYALPLAQAGYRVFVFEFLGHGRHRAPMAGDVAAVEGTTRLLVDQTTDVMDAVADPDTPVALIGHSMATDVLARVAAERPRQTGPMVLISAFSQVIDRATPASLLLVAGDWEPRLKAYALEAARMVNPAARMGDTQRNGETLRRAVAAPFSDHVSVLHSRTARAEARAWLDQAYGRTSRGAMLPTGWAIMGLLFGLVLVFRRIAQLLPQRAVLPLGLGRMQWALVLGAPVLLAPIIAVPLNPAFLPVLVADYLGLHLLVYGLVQLALLRWWRVPLGGFDGRALALLLVWCALFGFALNRYAANFLPTPERLWIIAVMLAGTLPYMLADATLTAQSGWRIRLGVRAGLLVSLAVAVALDFQGLFFLLLIAPVLVLFYLVFGTMGRDAARRGGPLAAGLALGLVLAWALGVSFPLFRA